ncbi:MAG: hypothetical protein E7631_06370 [Ruminococcaceae bacterium]|nr:hypothetical protein [Oscillospiraceae bacterium]
MKKTLSLIMAGLLTAAMALSASAAFVDCANPDVKFGVKGIAADVAWAADGEWTEGEYAEIAVDGKWMSAAVSDEANLDAAQKLDYKLGMSWDANYLYTYIEFYDANGHDNTYGADPGNMWQAGAIQVSAAEVDSVAGDRLEYGVGITSDTNELINTVWADYLGSGYGVAGDYIVVNDGDTMIYEIRTPFNAFSTVAPKEGAQYGVNLVLSWGNGSDYIHTQLAAGCTGDPGKAADRFADITLEEAIVIETEPEVVEDTAAAPQTFDAGVIAAVAAIVSAAGYAISKKR